MNPADAIKSLLESANVNVNGWNINVGKEPETPHRAITCYSTGGQAPSPKFSLDYPTVQVRVRGFPNNYAESRAKAEEIKSVLLGADPRMVGSDKIVSITGRGDIQDIGFDQTNRPLHTVNFQLIAEPAPSGQRIALP